MLTELPIELAIKIADYLSPQQLLYLAATNTYFQIIAAETLFKQHNLQTRPAQQKLLHSLMTTNPLLFKQSFDNNFYKYKVLPVLEQFNISYQLMGLQLKYPEMNNGHRARAQYISNIEQTILPKPDNAVALRPFHLSLTDVISWFSPSFVNEIAQLNIERMKNTHIISVIAILAERFNPEQLKQVSHNFFLMAVDYHNVRFLSSTIAALVNTSSSELITDVYNRLLAQKNGANSDNKYKQILMLIAQLQNKLSATQINTIAPELIQLALSNEDIDFSVVRMLLKRVEMSEQLFTTLHTHGGRLHDMYNENWAIINELAIHFNEQQANSFFEQLLNQIDENLNGTTVSSNYFQLLITLSSKLNLGNIKLLCNLLQYSIKNGQDPKQLTLAIEYLLTRFTHEDINTLFKEHLIYFRSKNPKNNLFALALIGSFASYLQKEQIDLLIPNLIEHIDNLCEVVSLAALQVMHKIWPYFTPQQLDLILPALVRAIGYSVESDHTDLVDYFNLNNLKALCERLNPEQLNSIMQILAAYAQSQDVDERIRAYALIGELSHKLSDTNLTSFFQMACQMVTSLVDIELRQQASLLALLCAEQMNLKYPKSISRYLLVNLQNDDYVIRGNTALLIKALENQLSNIQREALISGLNELTLNPNLTDENYHIYISVLYRLILVQKKMELDYVSVFERHCQQLIDIVITRTHCQKTSGLEIVNLSHLLSHAPVLKRTVNISHLVAIVCDENISPYVQTQIINSLGTWTLNLMQHDDQVGVLRNLSECISNIGAITTNESLLLISLSEAINCYLSDVRPNPKKRERLSLSFFAQEQSPDKDMPEAKRPCMDPNN